MDLKSLSELVKKEREKKGISYEMIYRDTKIMGKFIEYIENGKWDKFPGDFYKKAVLKKYLNYLGIEGINIEEVLNKKEDGSEEKIIEHEVEKNDKKKKEKIEKKIFSDRKFYLLIALFLLFVLLLILENLIFKNLTK
ncbi:MAG: helix-turn-helix domain-containing protein [Candidatus Ratteibacteria bacterium]